MEIVKFNDGVIVNPAVVISSGKRIAISGKVSPNTSGFKVFTKKNKLLGDYSNHTTVYSFEEGLMILSNDGSTFEEDLAAFEKAAKEAEAKRQEQAEKEQKELEEAAKEAEEAAKSTLTIEDLIECISEMAEELSMTEEAIADLADLLGGE